VRTISSISHLRNWARRAKLDDELDAIGLFASWTFTPEGRTHFPSLLLGAEINKFNATYVSRLSLNFAVLALKFAIGYGLAYVCALAAVYGLTRMGISLAPVQDFLSLGLIFGASAAGVYAAVTSWTPRQDPIEDLRMIGGFQAMASHSQLLCASFAPLVFVFHVAAENLIVRFDPMQAARLVGNPMTRAAVMAALVCIVSGLMLPSILSAKISRYLER
jgi:hypothetical protein